MQNTKDMKNGMKKLAVLALAALFSSFSPAAEPMATMKYVTNQINRLDKRIDESVIPPGYETFTNLAAKAIQPGGKISKLTNDAEYVTSTITNGLVSKEAVEELIESKRDKPDLYQYVDLPMFSTAAVEAGMPAYRPYKVVQIRSAEKNPKYMWGLVDTNNSLTASANSYDTIEDLIAVKSETFRYRGVAYELPVVSMKCEWRIYSGNGDDFSSYVESEIGKIATEKFVSDSSDEAVREANGYTDKEIDDTKEYVETKSEEIAERVVSSKGFATEASVASNYYDKGTVDRKVSTATPGNYETVSNRAMNAVLEEADPTVKAWAKAATKPSYTTDELDTYNKATIDSKDAALQAQIEAMTAFDVKEVEALPPIGEPGYIYLVPDPDSPGDKVNWMWIVDGGTGMGRWVKVGSTRVNLSDYAKKETTLAGYGITDAYTKAEADAAILSGTKYTSKIRATYPIGRFKPDERTGYVDIDVAGMTIQEGLEYIVSETLNPGLPKLPSISSISLAGSSDVEVGTVFTPTFTVSTDLGRYDYGPTPTGSRFDLLVVSDSNGKAVTNSTTGAFPSFNVTDTTSYSVNVKGHFTQGDAPMNNKGQVLTNENLRIHAKWYDNKDSEAQATTKSSGVVRGFRQWFSYIGSTIIPVDSELLWSNRTKKLGNCRTASTISSIEIPAGAKQITFALPKVDSAYGYGKVITSVIDIDGMGLEILNRFEVGETYVSARDSSAADAILYTTWTFKIPDGIAATHLKVTLADAKMPLLGSRDVAMLSGNVNPYQPCNNLNNNLNRQNAGPLDVSQLFHSQADLDYYRTKGRITFDVSEYWVGKVPYPYPGQVVSLHTGGNTEVCMLKPNADGEFDAVALSDTAGLDEKLDRVSSGEFVARIEQSGSYGRKSTSDVVRVGWSLANASRVLVGQDQEINDSQSIYATAVGPSAKVDGPWQVAVGKGASVYGTSSIAVGFNAEAHDGAVAIGYGTNGRDIGSVVISGRNDDLNNGGAYPGVDLTAKSHGFGSVNFNPYGGASGFWIGDATLQSIVKSASGSKFKVANGTFISDATVIWLYNGQGKDAERIADSYITNAVFNPSSGHCSGGRIRLDGAFAGQSFTGEEFTLVGQDDGTAKCTTRKSGVTYTITFISPEIPEDPNEFPFRGVVTVENGATAAKTVMYTFHETRMFSGLNDEVDSRPFETHTNSIITSKGMYDALDGKLSKSGDTAEGDFMFADNSEVDGWILPSFGWSGAKSYQVGTASKDGVTYEGGIGVGVSEPFKSNVKFPVSFRIRKQAGNEIREVNYTEDGVSEGSMTMMPQTPVEYRTVSFQRDEDGKLKAGTFALDEDYRELPGIVQGILDNGATKVHNKLAFKTSATAMADLASFDGSSELKVVKGENMKFTTDASSLTLDVDTNKVATVDFAKAVVPTWVATPDSETRFVTRMSGDGRRQKKRPTYKISIGSAEYEFNLSHMTKFEVDEDGAVWWMQFVNGNRVLDFQSGYMFFFWPDSRNQGRYYYVGKENGPYFSDDAPMEPSGGWTETRPILSQTGCDGGWYNAGSILNDTLSADDYWELDGRIDETAQGAHNELVAVSNSLMLVRSDRIYNMGKTGRFARYRVTRQQFGNTYVFDFELRADNKRDVSTGTWYDGMLIEQRQGGTPESLTFRMIAYNGTYAGNYAFYISIDGNAETTEKMPLPTELFPMTVGETKNLGVMTVQKLSQGDQVVDSYLYGDLTVRKTQDDSIKDRVPTSSEFDFSGDLFRPLTSADDVERVKTVLNAVIEKLKAVGQIEKGN